MTKANKKSVIKKIFSCFVFIFILVSFTPLLRARLRRQGVGGVSGPVSFRGMFALKYAKAAGATESWYDEKVRAFGNLNDDPTYPRLSVPVGDFGKDCAGCYTSPDPEGCFKTCTSPFKDKPSENWLGLYINAWFNYIIGAIGIFAVVMIMWGGIKWITAGGNAGQVDDAKGKIKNAVIGIVMLLCSYTIFKTINPALLTLSLPTIDRVEDDNLASSDYQQSCSTKENELNCGEPFQVKNSNGETINCFGKQCLSTEKTCLDIGNKDTLGGEDFKCRLLPCKNNDDSMCGKKGLICNMGMENKSTCTWNNTIGICCSTPARQNEVCAENSDCKTGLYCYCPDKSFFSNSCTCLNK